MRLWPGAVLSLAGEAGHRSAALRGRERAACVRAAWGGLEQRVCRRSSRRGAGMCGCGVGMSSLTDVEEMGRKFFFLQ